MFLTNFTSSWTILGNASWWGFVRTNFFLNGIKLMYIYSKKKYSVVIFEGHFRSRLQLKCSKSCKMTASRGSTWIAVLRNTQYMLMYHWWLFFNLIVTNIFKQLLWYISLLSCCTCYRNVVQWLLYGNSGRNEKIKIVSRGTLIIFKNTMFERERLLFNNNLLRLKIGFLRKCIINTRFSTRFVHLKEK